MTIAEKSRAILHAVPVVETESPELPLTVQRNALRSEYDAEQRAVWIYMNAAPRPCFSPQLLTDILAQQDAARRARDRVDFFVGASAVPGVFNLGGDLDLFRRLALAKDGPGLLRYAEACCRAVHNSITGLGAGIVTISLVQGDALGGGLEAALSSQIVIAEKGVKMGFPEIMFNLFPGMGAYSMMARKAGPRVAEDLITSGRTVSAEELHELGVVDYLAEKGKGDWVARNVISDKSHCLNGYRAFQKAKLRTGLTISYEELLEVTKEWVDAACSLEARDLKLMERLVRAQDRLVAGYAAAAAAPA